MTLTQIDLWIGKTLFVPPIIKLCHLTRQSQFAVSRMFWFAAALDGLYRAETTMGQVIWGGLSIFMLLTAGRRADSPTASFMFFRLLALALLILELVKTAASGEWVGAEFWVFVLFAEYAATIRTLPPADTARPRRQATEAR